MGADFVTIQKDTVPVADFVDKRKTFADESLTVLLHTRFATVGSARDVKCAHPVVSGRCAAIHNGTIWNDVELFDEIGVKRNSDVDSEVLPALIDFAGWDEAEDILGMTIGNAAAAVVHADRTDELILFRTSGFPLVYMVTDDLIVWASTRQAIVAAWQATYGRTKMGDFIEMRDWTLTRVKRGEIVSTVDIEQDADPPMYATEKIAKRPSWMKGQSYSVTKSPNTGRRPPKWNWDGVPDVPDDRPWQHDVLDAEFEELVAETAGRWTADGAWEQEAADDLRQKGIFTMTEEEFEQWCSDQGWPVEYEDEESFCRRCNVELVELEGDLCAYCESGDNDD
jgi:hypothetical protein